MGTGLLWEQCEVQEAWDGSFVKPLALEPPEQAVSEVLRSLTQPERPNLSVHLHGNTFWRCPWPLCQVSMHHPKGLGKAAGEGNGYPCFMPILEHTKAWECLCCAAFPGGFQGSEGGCVGSGQFHNWSNSGSGGGACPFRGPQTSAQPAFGQRQQNHPDHPGHPFKSLPGEICSSWMLFFNPFPIRSHLLTSFSQRAARSEPNAHIVW